MTALGKAKAKYIAPIEETELVCRMLEAATGTKRPPGAGPELALEAIDDETRAARRRAARAAMEYWRECIDRANRSN